MLVRLMYASRAATSLDQGGTAGHPAAVARQQPAARHHRHAVRVLASGIFLQVLEGAAAPSASSTSARGRPPPPPGGTADL